jgi:type I restriction enzyme M protein
MTGTIKQEEVNKAVWAACDTFRGTVSADIYKDYILTLLFLKYLSDVWQDHMDVYAKDYGNAPELIAEMMKNERFVLPKDASFYSLYDQRHEAGN